MIQKFTISLLLWVALLAAPFAPLVSTAMALDVCDQQCVTDLVRQGAILPLEDVIDRSGINNQGDILGVQVFCLEERWFYGFRLLSKPGNNVVNQFADATTGRIVRLPE